LTPAAARSLLPWSIFATERARSAETGATRAMQKKELKSKGPDPPPRRLRHDMSPNPPEGGCWSLRRWVCAAVSLALRPGGPVRSAIRYHAAVRLRPAPPPVARRANSAFPLGEVDLRAAAQPLISQLMLRLPGAQGTSAGRL